ncbi:NF-kappa-B inhibitor alpha-like isoform X2 [Rhopilema esculentum]|uniref:NF-kappa-B inhibitor alpha-like isoform X2 n=1 Tax=Rhopilema esculentum TaxID=499914 RepID=UPI0031CFE92B
MATRPRSTSSADKEYTDSGFTEDCDGQIANVFALEERHRQSFTNGRPEYSRSASCDTNILDQLKSQDEDGDSFLHIAIQNGNQDTALKIINVASKDTLEIKNNFGLTPLIQAIKMESYFVVESLLAKGVNTDSLDYQACNNLLHICAESGGYQMLEIFERIDKEALTVLANARNGRGQTPFHIAVTGKDMYSCTVLFRFGADIDAKDGRAGYTGLHLAVLTEDSDFVKDFISRFQPELGIESYSGYTPYGLAQQNDLEDIQTVLLQAGASEDVGSVDDEMVV